MLSDATKILRSKVQVLNFKSWNVEEMAPWIRIETAFQVNIQERQGGHPWPCSSAADRTVESIHTLIQKQVRGCIIYVFLGENLSLKVCTEESFKVYILLWTSP